MIQAPAVPPTLQFSPTENPPCLQNDGESGQREIFKQKTRLVLHKPTAKQAGEGITLLPMSHLLLGIREELAKPQGPLLTGQDPSSRKSPALPTGMSCTQEQPPFLPSPAVSLFPQHFPAKSKLSNLGTVHRGTET